jgi:hypothetical protein
MKKRDLNMRRAFTATTFLLLASMSTFAAQPAVDARLVLDEASLLPGTPTGLSVSVTNRGLEPFELPPLLWLMATNQAGASMTLRAQATDDASPVAGDLRIVPPGATREFRYDPTVAIVGSPWLTDDRLLPGSYSLRAVFAPRVEPNGAYDRGGAVVSNEAALNIAVESAEDAAVWEWMKAHGGGRWGDHAWLTPHADFAAFVMKEHPTSHYALFAAPFVRMRDHGDPSPLLEEQARRYPNKSFTDQLKLMMVQYHVQALQTARRLADTYRAANESDAARSIASELMRDSRSSTVRATAKELFEKTPSREQLGVGPAVR